MTVSFKYWDDCVDNPDLEAMWMVPAVSAEWLDAGETRDQKVQLSRDPDGQAYLTQTEMRAVAEIIVQRHFSCRIDPDMICAVAELASDRRIFASTYNKKNKETTLGIMQILPKTSVWLSEELGYCAYDVSNETDLLYRPFVNIYFGAAYLKWLTNYENKTRSEEFMVRAYRGGVKKATHKSTLPIWKRYLSVKETFSSRDTYRGGLNVTGAPTPVPISPLLSGCSSPVSSFVAPEVPAMKESSETYTLWDSVVNAEDMEDMWTHPDVAKEWSKSGERKGNVRFSHDDERRPYLSRVELRGIAEIILFKHFASIRVKAIVLCAIAEVSSKRFVNGVPKRPGIMGVDFFLASWLHNELGYKAYRMDSEKDLLNPFASMYYGASYMAWLSEYEGRERSPQFVVQAFFVGPQKSKAQESYTIWLKFEDALGKYQDMKRENGSCAIL